MAKILSGAGRRAKGKRGELAVAGILRDLLGWDVRRRVRQHDGDSDLTTDEYGWSAECKNCATLELPAWWRQTVAQSTGDLLPVLFYKQRGHWRARFPLAVLLQVQRSAMWTDFEWTADTTIEAWAAVARETVSPPPPSPVDSPAAVAGSLFVEAAPCAS